jgi:chaperone BCS1
LLCELYRVDAGRRPSRSLSSVVLEEGEAERVLADTRSFLASERWYAERGIPYRRGYLLYGEPGSGKTSLITALAGELQLSIYMLRLSGGAMDDDGLLHLLNTVAPRSIVLVEDIDAAFPDGRTGGGAHEGGSGITQQAHPHHQSHGITFSGLLNALDGVSARYWLYAREVCGMLHLTCPVVSAIAATHGTAPVQASGSWCHLHALSSTLLSCVSLTWMVRLLTCTGGVGMCVFSRSESRLLFLTTNHLHRLDLALIRPGRVDVRLHFQRASKQQAARLFQCFYRGGDHAIEDSRLAQWGEAFADQVQERKMSMAAIQGFLMLHRDNPQAAVKGYVVSSHPHPPDPSPAFLQLPWAQDAVAGVT